MSGRPPFRPRCFLWPLGEGDLGLGLLHLGEILLHAHFARCVLLEHFDLALVFRCIVGELRLVDFQLVDVLILLDFEKWRALGDVGTVLEVDAFEKSLHACHDVHALDGTNRSGEVHVVGDARFLGMNECDDLVFLRRRRWLFFTTSQTECQQDSDDRSDALDMFHLLILRRSQRGRLLGTLSVGRSSGAIAGR